MTERHPGLLTPDEARAIEGASRKTINVLTADIRAFVHAKDASDAFDIILSVPTKDRDGEVIDAKAFEPLPQGRLPIDVDHGMTVLTTVGSGLAAYDGDALMLRDFRFASTPLGQDVRTLVEEGHISKMSVAFMDAVREVDEKDGLPHVRKAELLNAAIVAIPSNREAEIAFAQKSTLKVGARNSAKDTEMIQSVHDSAAALGATCSGVTKSATLTDEETETHVCPTCGTNTDPEKAAAPEAAADSPADVDVDQALIELSLIEADLALDT